MTPRFVRAVPEHRRRWIALLVICTGSLMVVLDTTVVNVALPSIREDLHLPDRLLVWVVNAYLLTFGSCLLIGGRLGDLYGERRLLLTGVVLFSLASLGCGVSTGAAELIVWRAVQGIGGAVLMAVALALIARLFAESTERARAIGVYAFTCTAGGSVGLVLGGGLTGALNWHWVFLINLPVGVVVFSGCLLLLPHTPRNSGPKLNVRSCVAWTSSLILVAYATATSTVADPARTLALLGAAALALTAAVFVDSRSLAPLVPITTFRRSNLPTACLTAALWATGQCVWFVMSALYMQSALDFSPILIGLAFLPASILIAILSLKVSAWLANRFGVRTPVAAGLTIGAAGLFLLAPDGPSGTYVNDVLPGMLLMGICGGIVFNPLLLAVLNQVKTSESGLASGIINTAFTLGGALGLAVLANTAAARSTVLTGAGVATTAALLDGYRLAFMLSAAGCAAAAILWAIVIRTGTRESSARTGIPPTMRAETEN